MEVKNLSSEQIEQVVRKILEKPFWLESLRAENVFVRQHDDHHGTSEGLLSLKISCNGDVCITTSNLPGRSLMFRTIDGGGQSERVRNALIILALAIKIENEKDPQNGLNKPINEN